MLALLDVLLVILAPLRLTWWEHWPRTQQAAVVLLGLDALDDVAQHAFGWPTLLNQLWKSGLRGVLHAPL